MSALLTKDEMVLVVRRESLTTAIIFALIATLWMISGLTENHMNTATGYTGRLLKFFFVVVVLGFVTCGVFLITQRLVANASLAIILGDVTSLPETREDVRRVCIWVSLGIAFVSLGLVVVLHAMNPLTPVILPYLALLTLMSVASVMTAMFERGGAAARPEGMSAFQWSQITLNPRDAWDPIPNATKASECGSNGDVWRASDRTNSFSSWMRSWIGIEVPPCDEGNTNSWMYVVIPVLCIALLLFGGSMIIEETKKRRRSGGEHHHHPNLGFVQPAGAA